jgi:AcrR family transcriptional regulator
MKTKPSTAKIKSRKPAKKATRLKILKAARKVFAQYAYHAASIRMIGKEAKIDHPLISYYFPSKAVLFEAVLEDIVQEWHKANQTWFEGLDKMGPEAGLSLYIDRMLGYMRKHPYAAQVFLLNMVQAQNTDTIPGYQAIQTYFDQTAQLLKSLVPMQAADSDIEKFRQSFNTLVMSYAGAKSYYAGILGIPANSGQYKQWVKEMLMDLFLPRLKQLMHGKK